MSPLAARLLSPFLILAWLCTSTLAQDPTAAPSSSQAPTIPEWNGCINPNDTGNLDQKVIVGELTWICLVLSNSANWDKQNVQYIRLTFQPTADEFSRFFVPVSYRHLVTEVNSISAQFSGRDIAVHAESQKAVSFQKIYIDTENVFPELTAIIDVEDGVVKAISWDDGCLFCPDSECSTNTYGYDGEAANVGTPVGSCGTTRSDCDAGVTNQSTGCDLKLHIVWTGTDGNGLAFQSSAYRFSAFPNQDWSDNLNLPTSLADLGISLGA